jgi:hypothetical protein
MIKKLLFAAGAYGLYRVARNNGLFSSMGSGQDLVDSTSSFGAKNSNAYGSSAGTSGQDSNKSKSSVGSSFSTNDTKQYI